MNKQKQINVRVEAKMLEALQLKASQEYRQLSEIIRGLLVVWLAKRKA